MGCQLVDINFDKKMHKRAFGDNPGAGGTPMSFRAFGEDINLWLHPRDSLFASTETPVYFAYENNTVEGRVSYELQPDAMEKLGRLYEDAHRSASVVISTDPYHDKPTVTGNLRSKRDNAALVIRPLPEEVVEEHLRKRRSIDGNNGDRSSNSARHIVMKNQNLILNRNIGEGESSFSSEDKTTDEAENITIARIHSIYPKIFVTIDFTYWGQRSLRKKSEDLRTTNLLEYVLAFWNGVDLSYRQFRNPNIRLNIAGIVIAMSPKATPYLNDNLRPGDKSIHADQALADERAFYRRIHQQIPYDTYNIAVTMTRKGFKDDILGISTVGPVCGDFFDSKNYNGFSLVYDSGGFSGIPITVHELGHTLGIRHDGDGNACKLSDGFIMGEDINYSRNSLMFSTCSLARFNEILRTGEFRCMSEPPQKKIRNLPKPMPGEVLNLDQQCQAVNYRKACPSAPIDPCVKLCCIKTFDFWYSLWYWPLEIPQVLTLGVAPGTPCGNKDDTKPRFCLQNRCVSLN